MEDINQELMNKIDKQALLSLFIRANGLIIQLKNILKDIEDIDNISEELEKLESELTAKIRSLI